VLSAFHGSQLPKHAAAYEFRTANGLDPQAIVDGPNARDRFIYASSASAGLLLLLQMWPRVREELPSASLHVYYGFWPYAMWAEQKPLIELRAQIDPLLRAPGVVYHGMVSETELAQAYAQAGWYAYPSDKPETSGIALMKAQACGAVPITSGQLASALPETVGNWDLGPKARHGKIGIEPEWQQDYVQALLEAVRRPAAEMARFRQEMKEAARQRFSWATVAAQWDARSRAAEGGAGGSGGGGGGGGGGGMGGDTAQRFESGGKGQHAEHAALPPSPSRVRTRRKAAATVFVEVGLGGATGWGAGVPYNPALDAPELLARYRELHARRTQLQAQVESLEETARSLELDAS